MEELIPEGYDLEIVPNKASDENKTGITIKGSEIEYLEAHRILKNFFRVRGQKFNINGVDLRIVDLPKKLIKVEVKSKTGLSGKVNLNIYDVNNRGGATMMIQKVSGEEFVHVKVFGMKVIKFLIDGIIKGNINEESIEKYKVKTVTINEKIGNKNIVKCDICGRNLQTEEKLKIHLAKIHTDVQRFKCDLCSDRFESIDDLNSHIEEVHEILGSPDSKKLRLNAKSSKEIEIQVSEQDFEIEKEEEIVVEDMEIDSEEDTKKLSKLRDEKILHKQKLIEIEEENDKMKAFKKLEEEKKRKRQMSTEKKKRKKIARKEKSNEIQKESVKTDKEHEKIRQINDKFRPLFIEAGLDIQNFKIFRVKGDGACGSNCVALACHYDERLGQYVRRNINDFKVNHWSYFKDSMVFPHRQMVGHEEVMFENENEYLDFLKNNPKSGRLWMDHADFQAVSNYYQIEIHVLTTNVENMVEPRARWTHLEPDPEMKTFSPVPKGLPNMWLMHVDEIHFDLIVHKDSLLVTEGSIDMEKEVEGQENEKSFETNSNLGEHVTRRHEQEGLVKCVSCTKVFKTEEGLKDHVLKKHSQEGRFQCKECERNFKTEQGMKVHIRNKHEDKEMSKDTENKETEIGPGYMGWKVDDEKEPNEKDKGMAYVNLQKDLKTLEKRMSSLEKEYKYCMEALKEEVQARTKAEETAKVLKEIVEAHDEVDKRKTQESTSNAQEEMEIDEETGVWIQQQKRKSLKINKAKKKQEETLFCTICEEPFNYQSVLDEHSKTHTLSKLHSCQKCEKQFIEQTALKKHEEGHTQISSYSCEKCSSTFDQKSLLENHEEKHNKTNYNCEFREKSSSNENMIDEHNKSHTENESYSCEKCDKVYASMSKLRRHDWRSHRTIDCNICGINLESREDISNHRKIEHKMSRKIKCKFFPNCIDENECFFEHEEIQGSQEEARKSKYCLKGEKCNDQSCEYSEVNHLNVKNVMCRYQSKCKKPECMFKHIVDKASFLAVCTQNLQKK